MNNTVMSDEEQYKKLESQEYIAAHRIPWLMEHITTEVILFKPVDPFKFIQRRFREIGVAQEAKDSEGFKEGIKRFVTSSEIQFTRPKVICVIGGPASGKSLVAAFLNEQGMVQLNVNNAILEEMKKENPLSVEISTKIEQGEQISAATLAQLVGSLVRDYETTYVIEGYPRTMDQVLALEESVVEPMLVLHLRCSEEVLRERMNKGGIPEEQQIIKLKGFKKDTLPVVEYYKAQKKVVDVDSAVEKKKMLEHVKRIAWN